ncbi:hypothetical protein LEP3755_34320 [Leptolyngbya sp. NIES-3755]|nr:hypothetical protein LEP3755_34320 [Leptolyngbya sp. NIES-3755]
MTPKTITFNHVEIQMYERNGKLFMQPDHAETYDLCSLNQMILSGSGDKLYVYAPGIRTEELSYRGWLQHMEILIEIDPVTGQLIELESEDFEDDSCEVVRTPLTVKSATEGIIVLENLLYPDYLTEQEIERIYSLMDNYVLRKDFVGRSAGNQIYNQMRSSELPTLTFGTVWASILIGDCLDDRGFFTSRSFWSYIPSDSSSASS